MRYGYSSYTGNPGYTDDRSRSNEYESESESENREPLEGIGCSEIGWLLIFIIICLVIFFSTQ